MGSAVEDFDVIIIGAGISGINSAYLLQQYQPGLRYVILEGRNVIGGTWAYWKYPGARSDSNSAVFRFAWHHWPHPDSFADAAVIRDYIEDAAKAQGIDKHIRFQQQVGELRWSTPEQQWTVDVTDAANGATRPFHARWVMHCGGYYSYDKAQDVEIPGLKNFQGELVHPQFWPENVTLENKNVVLIGSGATAVTILPHIAKLVGTSGSVTMLQRSPSYIVAQPKHNHIAAFLQRWLPQRWADLIDWYRQITLEILFVQFITTFTNVGRRIIRKRTVALLPKGYPVDVHFNPKYTPFMQRLCFAPDGDFFQALHRPNCKIATDHIETVTDHQIKLKSGAVLDADVIITATGLHMQLFNGRAPVVDGKPVAINTRYSWRSCMLEGVPNACMILSYTSGTWTPGADAHFRTVLSVMDHMKKVGATSATPTIDPAKRAKIQTIPTLNLNSGYIQNAAERLPLATNKYPWVTGMSWAFDTWNNLTGKPTDEMVYVIPDKKRA